MSAAFVILLVASIIGAAMLPDAQQSHFTDQVSNKAIYQTQSQPELDTADSPTGIRECIVTLISGRRISGELIRQNSLIVVVGVNGINTTFQRRSVASIVILAPVEERYQEMRAAIPDDDIDSRLVLVEWLRARQAYALAIKELESVLIESPSNPQAKLLLTWLKEYDKLGRAKPSTKEESISTDSKNPPKERERSKKPQRNTIPPLTPEQINLLRVYEIDLRDPPKIRVPDDTLAALMTRKPNAFSPNKDERDAIFKLPEIEKLKILFTHKARDLYSQVIVLEDPQSIRNFKEEVHAQRGWIINACATTRCHGGPNAGRFQLINTHANSDETVYTNFLIIERYILDNGSSLIDYQAPERSPLLQMGMMGTNTLTPHPEIPVGFPGRGFRPIFRSTRDRKYREAIEWIRSMYQPRPEYEFIDIIQPEPKPDQSGP